MWKKEISSLLKTFTRPVVLLLLWQFVGTLLYHLLLLSPLLYKVGNVKVLYVFFIISIIHVISPVAGYLGDLKYTRFKLLQCGTIFIIAASGISLIGCLSLIAVTNYSINAEYWYFVIFAFFVIVTYILGYTFFTANFIQFSVDQLRDAPTRCCVLFLHMLLWTNSFGKTVSITTLIHQRNESDATISIQPLVKINLPHAYTLLASFFIIFLSSIIILCVANLKQKWFVTDKIRGNPYKLVANVLLFALKHKSPIRRSAFTFCEDELPSRIDFSKRRYGGPYSTDQVENVKVLLNILKVLFSSGPVFFLEFAAIIISTGHHSRIDYIKHYFSSVYLGPDLLSSVFIIFTLPLHVFFIKPLLEKCAPTLTLNYFKRIGLSILILTAFIVMYLLYDGLAYEFDSNHYSLFKSCTISNSSAILNWSIVYIPQEYMLIILTILFALSHMLLYISMWELICSQSPENMKGLLFGLLFAIRAFFQSLSVLLLLPIIYNWKSTILGCRTGYSLLNVSVGIVTLMLFVVCARKYKYRKRDDICNVYKFAEDYYSK